ncbi:hypothetical protein TanjilG_23972 [Lupinus angustifolius]|uniref:Cytochrome b561 and DOMON domain-containing protein n=1 Tax=Lupinus angustifolius TaxID=3871 RepID=A0A1J7H8K8_LUPAN|nr:PREDICTED: cytochrome b561 and DOMON domain-containing protein At3g25290-like [Lupinus angustifolius]OIV98680.1 hypothetical protein TanjilG_23972 [Lupinus angustifolius]
MAPPPSLLFFLLLTLFITITSSQTQKCTTQKPTIPKTNTFYSHCIDLPYLKSFIHYTYNPSNSSLSVAFIASVPPPSGWVSWGLNPTETGMAGTQAIAAYSIDGVVKIKTLDIKSYKVLVPGKLSYEVWDLSAEQSGGLIRIYATFKVPKGNGNEVNQVWQVGPSVTNGKLDVHGFASENLNAKGKLNLSGGQGFIGGGVDSRTKNKNIHGILNAVSWGVLFPLGVIIARYVKTFPSADPAWFYLHVGCQLSAYAIGVAGWATGLKLGSQSAGITYSLHRNIGIALFTLATIQIFALFLRPAKDHKFRFYWNIYHHSFGYAIVIMSLINIFKGFDILLPEKRWKTAYIGVIAALGVIAVLLEVITWIVVLKRKSKKTNNTYDEHNHNGDNREHPFNM